MKLSIVKFSLSNQAAPTHYLRNPWELVHVLANGVYKRGLRVKLRAAQRISNWDDDEKSVIYIKTERQRTDR